MPKKKSQESPKQAQEGTNEELTVITVSLPVSMRDDVRMRAVVAKMRSMSDWVRLAIEEKLQREGK